MWIRGGTLQHQSKLYRTFGLRNFSNIINLPYPCKLAQDMMFDEASEKGAFEPVIGIKGHLAAPNHRLSVQRQEAEVQRNHTPRKADRRSQKARGRSGSSLQGTLLRRCCTRECVQVHQVSRLQEGRDERSDSKTTVKAKHEHLVLCLSLVVKD